MSEINDAVQVVDFTIQGMGTIAHYLVETGKLGYKLLAALAAFIQQKKKEHLKGEVSVDKLARYEAKLSVCRFHDIPIEGIRELLDQYQIPYAIMPEAEINGQEYIQVMFGNSYMERMAAVIQTISGNGEIIDKASVIPYITEGQVALDVLINQDGMQQMVCRFPDNTREKVLEALDAYHIKYALLPDLNLSDGCFEIAFSPQQQMMVQAMVQKLQKGQIITFEDYSNNADPVTVEQMAEQYERLRLKTADIQIVSSQEDHIGITVPTEKIIYEDPEDPESTRLLAITNAYAIRIPDKDFSLDMNVPGKCNITIRAKEDYQKMLPDGSRGETEKGAEIIKRLQEIAAQHAAQEQTEQEAQFEEPPMQAGQSLFPAPQPAPVPVAGKKKTEPASDLETPDIPTGVYEDEMSFTAEAADLLRQLYEKEDRERTKPERSLGR